MTILKLLSLLLLSVTFCFGKDIPNKKRTPIINGTTVTNNQFPYQILISGGDDGGGTILNKRWILTAAHVAASGNSLQFYAGSYFLTVYATNTCGTISKNIIVQVNNCGFRVFPNPAQTTVAVEFEEPDKIESISDVIDLIDEKTLKKVKTKDVKALKEKEKNNPKAYGKIEFDVSDLPRGTYYLNMRFENKNGNKVEQTRIILTDK